MKTVEEILLKIRQEKLYLKRAIREFDKQFKENFKEGVLGMADFDLLVMIEDLAKLEKLIELEEWIKEGD